MIPRMPLEDQEGDRRRIRIVIGNEPRTYRDVLSQVLHERTPGAEIMTVEPSQMDSEIVESEPDMVLASRLPTGGAGHKPLMWVSLYPEGDEMASVVMGGETVSLHEIHLEDIVSLVGWVDWLSKRMNAQPPVTHPDLPPGQLSRG